MRSNNPVRRKYWMTGIIFCIRNCIINYKKYLENFCYNLSDLWVEKKVGLEDKYDRTNDIAISSRKFRHCPFNWFLVHQIRYRNFTEDNTQPRI